MKHIVCYSGGHSSAITAIESVRKFGKQDVILLNHDICPRSEHSDIKRFKSEVADYLDLPITYANMKGWKDLDQFDVCMKLKAFKYGIQSSALCTHEMKTKPFYEWLDKNYKADFENIRNDIDILYGFDPKETTRIIRRTGVLGAKGYKTDYPLLWENRTIHNTEEIKILPPVTYDIFNHANCKGCLKAGKQHWFIIYCLEPMIWNKAKKAEDEIGFSILKEMFLAEYEREFQVLKNKNFMATEKINPQRFWASARKLIKDDSVLPCECHF